MKLRRKMFRNLKDSPIL